MVGRERLRWRMLFMRGTIPLSQEHQRRLFRLLRTLTTSGRAWCMFWRDRTNRLDRTTGATFASSVSAKLLGSAVARSTHRSASWKLTSHWVSIVCDSVRILRRSKPNRRGLPDSRPGVRSNHPICSGVEVIGDLNPTYQSMFFEDRMNHSWFAPSLLNSSIMRPALKLHSMASQRNGVRTETGELARRISETKSISNRGGAFGTGRRTNRWTRAAERVS